MLGTKKRAFCYVVRGIELCMIVCFLNLADRNEVMLRMWCMGQLVISSRKRDNCNNYQHLLQATKTTKRYDLHVFTIWKMCAVSEQIHTACVFLPQCSTILLLKAENTTIIIAASTCYTLHVLTQQDECCWYLLTGPTTTSHAENAGDTRRQCRNRGDHVHPQVGGRQWIVPPSHRVWACLRTHKRTSINMEFSCVKGDTL